MSQDKPAAPDSGKPRSSNSGLIIVLVLVVALLCVGPLVVGGVVAVAGGVFASRDLASTFNTYGPGGRSFIGIRAE